jgi:uncharacterized protein YecE (DUF72 family)
MTDSPEQDKLQFLSEPIITASHTFFRRHGRQAKSRYKYLNSKEELKPWADKVKQTSTESIFPDKFRRDIFAISIKSHQH